MSQLACDGHLRNGEWLLLGQPPWSREWYLTSQKHEWLSNDNQTKQGSPSVSKCAFKPKRNAACLPSKPSLPRYAVSPLQQLRALPARKAAAARRAASPGHVRRIELGRRFLQMTQPVQAPGALGVKAAGEARSQDGPPGSIASGPLGGYQVGREDEWG